MQRRDFIRIMATLTGAAIVAPDIVGKLTWRYPEAAPQLWDLMNQQQSLGGPFGSIPCEYIPTRFMDEILQLARKKDIDQLRRRAGQRIDKEVFDGLDDVDGN